MMTIAVMALASALVAAAWLDGAPATTAASGRKAR